MIQLTKSSDNQSIWVQPGHITAIFNRDKGTVIVLLTGHEIVVDQSPRVIMEYMHQPITIQRN